MNAQLDVPVALVFFNRPEQFAKVFEEVRKAKPSKLFLIQDGPRENNAKDKENIAKCREVLKGIDWECDVAEDFSDENLGCGRRVFSGISKCFEQVDRLIILEDDCVPSQSFFPFCRELLEKYKDDQRIGLISGMNHLNRFDASEGDYLFSMMGSIAGWATWKRSWEQVSFDLGWIADDENAMRLLKNFEKYSCTRNSFYSMVKDKNQQLQMGKKISSWSTQFGSNRVLNSQLYIVPKVNLMTNIGLTAESANSVSNIKLVSRGLRPLYRLKLYDMEFPLKHPKYVMNDIEYSRKVDKLMRPKKPVAFFRKVESVVLRIVHGDFASLKKGLKRKIQKIFR